MFLRMYIVSFLRNMLIFMLILPMLGFYILSLVYRVPNIDKENLLTYIVETNDMSVLETPVKQYFYFCATVDADGDIETVSDTALPVEIKERFLSVTMDKDFHGLEMAAFNVVPDEVYHHYPVDEYYISSKREFDESSQRYTYHIIYNIDEVSFAYNWLQIRRAILFTMIAVAAISLLFAFIEIHPTRTAWYNQKRFIANTSHELRTPLTVINSLLTIEEDDVSALKQNLAVMSKEAGLMTKIVKDLMLLSRADAKQIKLKKEPADLYTLLLESYITAEVLGVPKGIRFKDFNCEQVTAYVDDSLIRHLLRILLENAIQYTPAGGFVALSCKRVRSSIEITVEDSGVGIAKKDRRRIFMRFYRVDNSQTSNAGNSGLGLAIALWIVKKHRGLIRCESTPGEGSRFIVRLPIGRCLILQ